MRLLAIADRPSTRSIRSLIEENSIDVVVTLGDLEYHDLALLEEINDIPKVGVYGNHCAGNYFESLGITNLHLHTMTIKGIVFGGFEGSVRYKDDEYAKMYSQEEAGALLNGFPRVDVFLAHSPPFGINDEVSSIAHQGFIALRKYVEEMKPAYLFHGHTYPAEEQLVTKYQNTEIRYVYQDKIIEIPLLL
jgi:Icc-related predicted phosphoesterase